MAETDTPIQNKRQILPFSISFEPRLAEVPGWFSPVLSLVAIVVALLIGALVIKLAGGDPWRAYKHIGEASFGSLGVFSDTLVKAIPLMLVGLACSLAFRMKIWNIGGEGQFYMGAFGASLVVLVPICLPKLLPGFLFQ